MLEKKILKQKDKKLYIGMTPSLVINDKNLLISSGLLLPIIILISLLTKNNHFLPISSISSLIYLAPFIISITNDSIVRIVVIGSIILTISNYIVSKIATVFTALANTTNIAIPSDNLVSSLDMAAVHLFILLLKLIYQVIFSYF